LLIGQHTVQTMGELSEQYFKISDNAQHNILQCQRVAKLFTVLTEVSNQTTVNNSTGESTCGMKLHLLIYIFIRMSNNNLHKTSVHYKA
jgi:hypothetical protein